MSSAPRFCPFCREPFEDVDTCPDHGLVLVDFLSLEARVVGDDALLSLVDPAYGRAPMFVACLGVLFGFVMPAVHDAFLDRDTSALELFQLHASYLAVVPSAALLGIYVLLSRRTRAALRRVRVGMTFAFALAALALGTAGYHVARFGLDRAIDGQTGLSLSFGGLLLFASTSVGLVASTRLGAAR